MLSSITRLKRYCKATLNVFLNKKTTLMMTIFFNLYGRFSCQIKILLLTYKNWLKFQVFPGFLVIMVQNSGFFKIFQIPGFPRISGNPGFT